MNLFITTKIKNKIAVCVALLFLAAITLDCVAHIDHADFGVAHFEAEAACHFCDNKIASLADATPALARHDWRIFSMAVPHHNVTSKIDKNFHPRGPPKNLNFV